MININYLDETGRKIPYTLKDWDAVISLAQTLSKAPIDLEYVYYTDGNESGVFNLNTFERC